MMPVYIEYILEEGLTVLVRAPKTEEASMVKASLREGDVAVVKAERKFTDALESVRRSAIAIKQKLEDLRADEVEVKFGLTTTGKLGNFAIAEVGLEANYEITLRWKNPPAPEAKKRPE
jgi:hypothetical protein